MMVEPSLDELMEKVQSPYTLAIAAARRARLLANGEGEPLLEEFKGHKDVSHALEEIVADKVLIKEKPKTKK